MGGWVERDTNLRAIRLDMNIYSQAITTTMVRASEITVLGFKCVSHWTKASAIAADVFWERN
eukprot:1338604-Amorphochlora_amoeboformis.AAC.2